MLPISYPVGYDAYLFKQNYLKNIPELGNIRDGFENFKKRSYSIACVLQSITLEKILLSSLQELYSFSSQLESIGLNSDDKSALRKVFNYDDKKLGKTFHDNIKDFFENNLRIKTCYYCNLDFVNVFNDIHDFHDHVDFVKKASIDDLCKIQDIADVAANKIHSQKANISSIDDIAGISAKQKENLKNIALKEKASHFTLDHVLDKASHPLLALSLYNFVPSCYACNSKFKGTEQFINNNTVGYLSPTGENFSFSKDVKFKLFFNNGGNIGSVASKNDFVLDFDYSKNKEEYEKYINTFKLKGRYIFHKDEIVNLVEKKKRYSSSKIEEMAKTLGISVNKVKEDLFGKELFYGNPEDKSMTKFKRDIARDIGIKGVL